MLEIVIDGEPLSYAEMLAAFESWEHGPMDCPTEVNATEVDAENSAGEVQA